MSKADFRVSIDEQHPVEIVYANVYIDVSLPEEEIEFDDMQIVVTTFQYDWPPQSDYKWVEDRMPSDELLELIGMTADELLDHIIKQEE